MKTFSLISFLTCALLIGCGGKSKTPDTESTPQTTTQTDHQAAAPSTDPAAYIDAAFLPEQAKKREELLQAIADYNKSKGDPGQIRYKILTRKGELMSAKRNIRASSLFTQAQKDSLTAPLEDESISLATDLLAVSK